VQGCGEVSAPDNPPAFPRTGEGFGNPLYDAPGMTLWDYFAAAALPGLIRTVIGAGLDKSRAGEVVRAVTGSAGEFADAMLAERKARGL
jgi:hypothetical protein